MYIASSTILSRIKCMKEQRNSPPRCAIYPIISVKMSLNNQITWSLKPNFIFWLIELKLKFNKMTSKVFSRLCNPVRIKIPKEE